MTGDDPITAGAILREPTEVPVAALAFADPPELHFPGFTPDSFAVLDRLAAKPDLEQYRLERGAPPEGGAPGQLGPDRIGAHIKAPFAAYRDDLVVNFVAPSALRFETDRGVFSRLPKNDFGKGGCKSNLWMAFYRPPRKRLTDAQLSHCIKPEGFHVGLFVGPYGRALLTHAKARITDDPDRFLAALAACFDSGPGQTRFSYRVRHRGALTPRAHLAPLDAVPDDLARAQDLAVRTTLPRDHVIARGPALVTDAFTVLRRLWPLYRALFAGRPA